MLCCKQKQQVKQKKTGDTGPWHPLTLAQAPPPLPYTPPRNLPKMGFRQKVVPKQQNTQNNT